ncbi:MAG: hypothetical protein ACREIA_18130, partial [Opitutaceae bacterium]
MTMTMPIRRTNIEPQMTRIGADPDFLFYLCASVQSVVKHIPSISGIRVPSCAFVVTFLFLAATYAAPPNVVIIVADDLGYA